LDLLIASFSIGLGAISSVVFNQIRKQRIARVSNNKKNRTEENYFDINKNSSDLAMMKNELDSLEVERSIITSSARKIHETFREGKLSQLEFDRLIIKYGEDLRKCDKQIEQSRSIVDLYDLSSIRNNLVSIIEGKIKVIDSRLSELFDRNLKIPAKQLKQTEHRSAHQNFENTPFRGTNVDNSLRIEAEKIKKLEAEVTQTLEKLDSYESTKSEGISKNEILKSKLDLSRDLNVTSQKDPLRNFRLSE
jgi:hypothetical protein